MSLTENDLPAFHIEHLEGGFSKIKIGVPQLNEDGLLNFTMLGHEILRMTSFPVSEEKLKSETFQDFLDLMIDTMLLYDGVGLAAPQVGYPFRFFIYIRPPEEDGEDWNEFFEEPESQAEAVEGDEFEDAFKEGDDEGAFEEDFQRYLEKLRQRTKVIINPELTVLSEETFDSFEGCLSLGDLRGMVPRHKKVGIKAFDRNGEPIEFIAEDFHAAVVQHEYDHLNGILFIDRMKDFSTLCYREGCRQ